jgi:ribosomal-protein-alanine N-acetyltransferase
MGTEPIIRSVTFSDKAMLVSAHVANRDFHHPWCAPFIDGEGFDDWWSNLIAGPKISFLAFDFDKRLVGVVNLSEIVFKSFRSAYLGYYGMREGCGRGLMTEAVRAVTQIAFHDLGLHRLEANIQPGNVRSIRLAERLNFSREGFSPKYLHIDGAWRDHERWALVGD